MPLTSILILSVIVLAFAVFAAVLAWSEHQTRHWRQNDQPVPENGLKKVERDVTASHSNRQRALTPV
jgi:multisubunit Na+/H+ antiporter MnhC subunit